MTGKKKKKQQSLLKIFNFMLKRNVTFDKRTHDIHTQWNISDLDSSPIENIKISPPLRDTLFLEYTAYQLV